MSHSPEPWRVVPSPCSIPSDNMVNIVDATGVDVVGDIACVEENRAPYTCPEDADRIVACVNFCAGLTNEFLLKRREGEE